MLTTVAFAVLVDFVTAILIGLVVAALVGAARSERQELDRLISVPLLDITIWPDADAFSSRVALVILPDRVSVASARSMERILRRDIKVSEAVIFDFSKTTYVDDTAGTLIGQMVAGKPAIIAGVRGEASAMLSGFADISDDRLAADMAHARQMVREML